MTLQPTEGERRWFCPVCGQERQRDDLQPARKRTVDHTEALRQLNAAREGRFREKPNGRYEIVGERRPDRKTREWLARQGFIEWHSRWAPEGYAGWRLTQDGLDALPQFEAEVG